MCSQKSVLIKRHNAIKINLTFSEWCGIIKLCAMTLDLIWQIIAFTGMLPISEK